MKTRFYLQENRPRVIATNTHYFYIGILVAILIILIINREIIFQLSLIFKDAVHLIQLL